MKKPSKKTLDAAVDAARLYHGSTGAPLRAQQRLYEQMRRKCANIAKNLGVDEFDVRSQVQDEARRRGSIVPRPGKDY
jgi:hypothetical protein